MYHGQKLNENLSCIILAPCVSWSQWDEWSECSANCGGGFKKRVRFCPIEGACEGESEEEDECNTISCDFC